MERAKEYTRTLRRNRLLISTAAEPSTRRNAAAETSTCWECSARFLVDYIKRRETASVVSIRAGS